MSTIIPKKNESPLSFIERADALKVPEESISLVLKEHFGFTDDGEIKELKLQSKVFWEQFYLDRVVGIFQRGGSRYSAIKFIQRKNAYAEQRRKLSDNKINELVDSVGQWRQE
jgi:hypothetical protein